MKFTTTVLFLTAVLLANESNASNVRSSVRKLVGPVIAGFEPSVDVTDLSRIDLDQRAMETQNGGFSAAAFERGRKIYNEGGNSESYAVLTLSAGLPAQASLGVNITGVNAAGGVVNGVAYELALSGSTTLLVRYNVGSSILPCAVGGLTVTNTSGCLAPSGVISVGTTATNIGYSYDVNTGNRNGRSMKKFITENNIKMRRFEIATNAFYSDFQKFVEYYGVTDYTDKIVNGAIDGLVVTLAGRPYDFSSYDFNARDQIIKKTVHYQLYAMYVIRQMEVALEKCTSVRRTDALRALDEAVAIYAGSQEGALFNGTGSLLLVHSQRRCGGFKTCGVNGDATTGFSKNNLDVLAKFGEMKTALNSSDCTSARAAKEFVSKKIFVPFIQGAFRYGYLQSPPGTGKSATAEAEGAAFMMAFVPNVARCNAAAANLIYNEMKPNSGFTVDFNAVKAAVESTYPCMGIVCADMGGFWDSANNKYFDGAGPCIDQVVTAVPTRAPVIPVPPPQTAPVAPVTPVTAPTPAPDNTITGKPFTLFPVEMNTPTAKPARRRGFFARIFDFIFGIFGF